MNRLRIKKIVSAVLLLTLCFAGGWALQRTTAVENAPPRRLLKAGATDAEEWAHSGERKTMQDFLTAKSASRLATLAQMLPGASVKDLEVLLDDVVKVDGWNDAKFRLIFTRWAELDAEGMIAAVSAKPLGWRYVLLRLAMKCQVEQHGPAVLESIRKRWPQIALDAAGERVTAVNEDVELLLPCFYGTQEKASGAWVAALNMPLERRFKLAVALRERQFIEELTESLNTESVLPMAEAVLALAKDLPEGFARRTAMKAALSQMAHVDPDKFRAAFEALPPGTLRNSQVFDYTSLLAQDDLNAAVSWASSRPAGEGRFEALFAAGSAVFGSGDAERASKLALEAWRNCPGDYEARSQHSGHWAFFGPLPEPVTSPGGFPVTPEPSGVSNPHDFLKVTFNAWKEAEPGAATAWLNSLPDIDLRSALTHELINDPRKDLLLIPSSQARLLAGMEEAKRGLKELVLDTEASTKDFTVARDLAAADWEAVIRERLPAELQPAARLTRMALLGVTDRGWAQSTTEERRFLAGMTIYQRASSDPQAALDFFHQMPAEERSLEAWHDAGQVMLGMDPRAATKWINSLPAGAERDAAVTAMVEHLTSGPAEERDSAAAMQWAMSAAGKVEREQLSKMASGNGGAQ